MERLLKAKSEAKNAARTVWGSATAYMLVYRLQDGSPVPRIMEADVPAELRALVAKENADFQKERAEYKAKADQLIIKVLHKGDASGFTLSIDKHQPLSALVVCIAQSIVYYRSCCHMLYYVVFHHTFVFTQLNCHCLDLHCRLRSTRSCCQIFPPAATPPACVYAAGTPPLVHLATASLRLSLRSP